MPPRDRTTVRRQIRGLGGEFNSYTLRVIYKATIEHSEDGDYLASCEEPAASASGLSPTNALDRLRAEIRYRIELCPCSGVDDDYVELEVDGWGGL